MRCSHTDLRKLISHLRERKPLSIPAGGGRLCSSSKKRNQETADIRTGVFHSTLTDNEKLHYYSDRLRRLSLSAWGLIMDVFLSTTKETLCGL